ncbi:restriction endonuclease subunit S [Halalkalibacter sp. AB-rgal2]|uniref:restriction endonuclease subunit S n=1 Tax=Halalkalibacter sp. AB-rgal2 TaxID=3242695 RepID=UPI00359CD076
MNNSRRKVGEICEVSSSKRIFMKDYVEEGIPFYRSKEIIKKHNGQEISDKLYISTDKFNEIKEKFGAPSHGDILLTSVGTIGVPYIVGEGEEFYFKDGNLTWFKNFSSDVSNKYVYYWLQSPKGKWEIDKQIIGSTQKALTIQSIKEMEIEIPPLEIQSKVVEILDNITNKIELNIHLNQTLEEMAMTLYKHWFVDFGPFQDEKFIEAELGKIPIGWKIVNLKDVADINKRNIKSDFPYEKIQYIDISSVYQGKLENYTEYVFSDAPSRAKRLVNSGDVIWSTVRPNRKSFLYIYNPYENTVVSTGFAVLTPVKIPSTFLYLHVITDQFVSYLVNNAKGSAYPAVNATTFKDAKFCMPPKEVLKEFDDLVLPWIKLKNENDLENINLKLLVDFLLPKLISGDIDLSEAEEKVENVMQ